MKRVQAVILDKDGTLVNGTRAVLRAPHFMRYLEQLSVPYIILSNTGTKTPVKVAQSVGQALGVPIPSTRVLTARSMMSEAVLQNAEGFSKIFELEDHDALGKLPFPEDALHISPSEACIAVYTDGKLDKYAETLTRIGAWLASGATLWMTSSDSTVTVCSSDGKRTYQQPGPGAILQTLKEMVRKSPCPGKARFPCKVFGKGGTSDEGVGKQAMRMLQDQGFHGSADQVWMIGDRFDTDVKIGRCNGWSTCLVETGCHTEADANSFPQYRTNFVASDVMDVCGIKEHWLERVQEWLHSLFLLGIPRRIQSAPDLTLLGS